MSTIDQIKKDIDKGVKFAVVKSGSETRDEIMKYVDKFYSWNPEYYVRTMRLRNSLTQPELIPYSPGYKSRMYFDVGKLNYSTDVHLKKPLKFLTGDGTHIQAHGQVNSEEVLKLAMEGSSSAKWRNPTRIWTESKSVLDAKAKDIVKKNLDKYLK